MAALRTSVFNAEKALFTTLACLFVFFAWRAFDVRPAPPAPGAPRHAGTRIVEGYAPPADGLAAIAAPDFDAAGARNPFGQAFDSLKVVATDVTSVLTVSPSSGAAVIDIGYRILPRPVKTLKFWLPVGIRLAAVEGDGIPSGYRPEVQDFGENGKRYLVRLRSGVLKRYQLRLRLAWLRKPGEPTLSVPELLLLDATHERGLIALAAAPRTKVSVRTAENVTPVSTEGLRLPSNIAVGRPFAAFTYRSHPYRILLDVTRAAATARVTPTPTPTRNTVTVKPPPKTAPGTKVVGRPPTAPRTPTQRTDVPTPPKEWVLPVGFVGTAKLGDRRCVLLKDKAGGVTRKFEGDKFLGVTIVRIYPASVIVENDKGERFLFKDRSRVEHDY